MHTSPKDNIFQTELAVIFRWQFVSKILFAQNTIDTLYNPELGAQSFSNIITDSVNNKTYIICNSANFVAYDSSFYSHIIIYEYLIRFDDLSGLFIIIGITCDI